MNRMTRLWGSLLLIDSSSRGGAKDGLRKLKSRDVQRGVEFQEFDEVELCSSKDREGQTVVSDLDGTLLRGRSSFPYFMLIAFEVGGYLRSVLLLLAAPIIWLLYHFVSEAAGVKLMIFVSFAGLNVSKIQVAARAVLPRFYAQDVHPETWRVFSSFGKRYVLSANPRIMIEAFGREYLGADEVIGTEIEVSEGGRATGFVKAPGILVGEKKAAALRRIFSDEEPDVGLGDRESDFAFMSMCKESYIVPEGETEAVPKESLLRPLIFHDGRFAVRPTPFVALVILIYMPFGFVLAVIRMACGILLPISWALTALRILGVVIKVKGAPPARVRSSGDGQGGVLFVCSHRTLLDPVMLAFALGRQVTAVTYSISRLSEIISPIRTVPLSRDREKDAKMIKTLLAVGNLAICPEGTTCREPFLLRFSALFAELTDQIVPVALANKMTMFHATSAATGWKGMDPFYFFMDIRPTYEVNFLEQLPPQLTCAGGKKSHEVANYIQRLIAGTLGFECTSFTRKDKYRALAGNDGSVGPKKEKSWTLLGKAKCC
ncbi:hypothetical protein R1flu_023069 [Riccia fluitans]|uniref:Phospholipid/glycerol acyltransferase domain-containing protein n=1 Tax=Riccia fluitans TaxID=41844 RepID=A0ABD1XQZ9_9MARC